VHASFLPVERFGAQTLNREHVYCLSVARLISGLKVTTLAENMIASDYLGQWGLSFLLEFSDSKGDERTMIFDTGMNKQALMYNIKKLKVNLSDVNCVVLSHGHLDHTGATVEVVKAAGGVKVYAHPHTFLPRFHVDKTGKKRQIGVPRGEHLSDVETAGGKVMLSTEPIEVMPGLWTTGQVERVTSFEKPFPLSEGERLIILIDGKTVDDCILDDQALWMDVEGVGPVVITGCAHAGPVNTLLHVQKIGGFKRLYGLLGGTHLVGRSEAYVQQTLKELKRFGLSLISPCHCTGFKATVRLWQAFPEAFVMNFSGRIIQAGKEPESRVF
jgi:7,8-dihydropterin-6-yl-methyl-4-(beta-D-ribofuranosyl)aminobenzene 5'-phosphate synthase